MVKKNIPIYSIIDRIKGIVLVMVETSQGIEFALNGQERSIVEIQNIFKDESFATLGERQEINKLFFKKTGDNLL